MFDAITQGLQSALKKVFSAKKLTEDNISEALADIRTALLAADVHFRVARELVETIRTECVGQKVIESVEPAQMVVKLVHDQIQKALSSGKLPEDLGESGLVIPLRGPLRILLCGLQGSGKTTAAAKLAVHLKKFGIKSLLIACDLQRPAAIEQLRLLAEQSGADFFSLPGAKTPLEVAQAAFMQKPGYGAYIFDTAGRLQIDEALMAELKSVADEVDAQERLLVVDSALGAQAINVAESFHKAVGVTGIVLAKLDGDARGGAALSIASLTGLPIRFAGVGEHPEDFERFYPKRMAGRILGMGDVVSLVEKAQQAIDQKEAEALAQKAMSEDFNLEDLLKQFQQVKKLGDMGKLVQMLPGASQVEIGSTERKKMAQSEAIILGMTPHERHNPALISGRRLARIAKGSGVTLKEVNALLKQFNQMRSVMRMMKGSKGREMIKKLAQNK